MSQQAQKINAAKGALDLVKNGMCIGLGSGTTVKEFITLLGQRVKKEKLGVCVVCTSYDTRMLAIENGIWVSEPDAIAKMDLAIDGADVVTKTALLKGGGAALTREKIIDYAATEFVVIADESKVKESLSGEVVVEVLPFAVPFIVPALKKYCKNPKLRMSSEKLGPVVTDNGGFIIDCEMDISEKDARKIETELNTIPGVVENGIFTKFSKIIIGTDNGYRTL
ncbi:TPA: ribose 5-phosphate isomerase A [Candidatus Micrarchaeota archaeon]|nr:ribose 5-phosphate isomerase A [Candidatus Micrarchaeota archaeon]